MQLRRIKVSGFKSFVDPTVFHLPSRLVGIVGPNGCGKSNVIDAVRWVMGESSAKTLRGESMADVIFNGSTARKPVGQASVELIFDNSDGRIGGQYASYGEIAIRRLVTRDGQSVYFLNGSRCRRKDIADVFLGTGFGPRSYSIIEQGMISRLVEARPEELRIFFEEAAGISKYKERRKETEARLNETRENLARIADIRDELKRQLDRLARQAEAANRYQTLKIEEQLVRGQLLAMRWRALAHHRQQQEHTIGQLVLDLERHLSSQRHNEALLEEAREASRETHEQFSQAQGRVYSAAAEVTRLEQTLRHAQDNRRRQEQELERQQANLDQAKATRDTDQQTVAELAEQLALQEEQADTAEELAEDSASQLEDAEAAWADWQFRWENLTHQAQQPHQAAQLERARLTHLEQQQGQLAQRRERLMQEQGGLDESPLVAEVAKLTMLLAAQEEHQQALLQILEKGQTTLQQQREANQQIGKQLDQARHQRQQRQGRLTSLETLQQGALGKGKGAVGQWLEHHGLSQALRLAETLTVAPGWERAAEVVLGLHLEAVGVTELPTLAAGAMTLSQGNLELWTQETEVDQRHSTQDPPPGKIVPLLDRLAVGQLANSTTLAGMVAGVGTVTDLPQALAQQATLEPGQSLVTPEGVWLGRNWLRVTPGGDSHDGVLAREQEIRQLRLMVEEDEIQQEALSSALEAGRLVLVEQERQREQTQAALRDSSRHQGELKARSATVAGRLEQLQQRVNRLREEVAEIIRQENANEEQMGGVRRELHRLLEQVDALAEQRERLEQERQDRRVAMERTRRTHQEARDQAHRLALEVRTTKTRLEATRHSLSRAITQAEGLAQATHELATALANSDEPLAHYHQELEERLIIRLTAEGELTKVRRHLEEMDQQQRQLDQARLLAERQVEQIRGELEQARVGHQETVVRSLALEEQAAEAKLVIADSLSTLPPEAEEGPWQGQLDTLGRQIQRLGAINLAAIEEYQASKERAGFLESQYTDLATAVDTLEGAIRKIDKETRSRFQETFDQVNSGLQVLFPRLFGGGHAYLELTGENLLETGVTIMARPPGKRNSTIHLLSGGEKALTAVALVFSIFQLNPAPVCLLDEVDAPLDEANVGRFCAMVREMAERVQFIFITHNKTTMEMAEHLTGVTMQEPGVSRLVAVNVAEAVELAAV